jgi:hypothetical protein
MTTDVTGMGGLGWRASSRCVTGECVQVAMSEDNVIVRGSANPELQLRFSLTEWNDFLAGVRAGDFDDIGRGSGS